MQLLESSTPPAKQPARHPVAGALACLALAGLAWASMAPTRATAAVLRGQGFEGTVLGWTSWYGSYQLAGLGSVWCIDHGSHAPDAAFGYRPASAGPSQATTTAMAWLAARFGSSPDPVDAAAVMLALHDLRGAVYPYGRLDLGRLRPSDLSGFDGRASEVLGRARALVAEAAAHGELTSPLRLAVTFSDAAGASADDAAHRSGSEAAPVVVAHLLDAAGRPVSGIPVRFALSGASATGPLVRSTGVDGSAVVSVRRMSGPAVASVQATVPDLRGAVYAPTAGAAQRVIRPATVELSASTPPPTSAPPTTPTTSAPTTTTPPTSAPPTTTTPPTSAAPTTTPPATAPPTTTPPATAPPTSQLSPGSSPSEAVPAAPTTSAGRSGAGEAAGAGPPAQTHTGDAVDLPGPSNRGQLARTGVELRAWSMIACGLLFAGCALAATWPPAQGPHHSGSRTSRQT